MKSEKFQNEKKKLFSKIKERERLDEDLKERIKTLYGDRGERAIKVIEKEDVRYENGRWFVQGREEEYEVVKSHCACYDYVLNIATDKAEVDMCYHALAKKIRELLESE